MIRVAINGFGRIGRLALRRILQVGDDLAPVAINSRRGSPEAIAHLFRYDTVYGKWAGTVTHGPGERIVVDGRPIAITRSERPNECEWERFGVDVVLESTGAFTRRSAASGHLAAGAKKVLVSAPMRDDDVTIVRGVNDHDYNPDEHRVISGGSCTTNCLAPLAYVLDAEFGIAGGLMTTIHAYTRDQEILDGVHDDLRRARAAGENLTPTKTGAAHAIAKVLPALADRLVGIAVRVPVATVSLVDLSVTLTRRARVEDINEALALAAVSPQLSGILGVSDELLVSSDFRGDSRSCVVDLASSRGAPGNTFKVLAWYDNEWAYACRMTDLVGVIGGRMPSLAHAIV